jgi:hypothetical protein
VVPTVGTSADLQQKPAAQYFRNLTDTTSAKRALHLHRDQAEPTYRGLPATALPAAGEFVPLILL